jgi:hypothetical protein
MSCYEHKAHTTLAYGVTVYCIYKLLKGKIKNKKINYCVCVCVSFAKEFLKPADFTLKNGFQLNRFSKMVEKCCLLSFCS